ncbi:MAG: hypothetical protein ABI779_26940 [Acidobacteriota bacterium]
MSDPNDKDTGLRTRASGKGIYIDGSYGDTKERRTKKVDGFQAGPVKTEPGSGYHLQYLIEFDLSTEGPGADATQFMFRGKITPALLYFTK